MTKRLAGALLAALFTFLLVSLPGASAQVEEPASVELRLLSQRSFATERRAVNVEVQAVNNSTVPIQDLSVSLTIYHATDSRTAYGVGLVGEPPTAPLLIETTRLRGDLAAGRSRDIAVVRKVPELGAEGENGLFPMKVQLEAAGVPVAAIRTSLAFIGEEPLVPLNVSLALVLDEGVHVRGDGVFADDDLAAAIAPRGSLDRLIAALESKPIPMTLVVAPLLLRQLEQMADGYRVTDGAGGIRDVAPDRPPAMHAREALSRLGSIARRSESQVIALPYAGPSIPSLVDAGLLDDLVRQINLGRQEFARLLGIAPSNDPFVPPGSLVSAETLDELGRAGIGRLLLDGDTLLPPEGLVLSPSAAATLAAPSGRSVQAIAADALLAARMEALPVDPRLAAQWILGDLSALYFEQPSLTRGASVIFEGETASAAMLKPFLHELTTPGGDEQWLRPVTASSLLAMVAPLEGQELAEQPTPRFSALFLADLARTREAIARLDAMTIDGPLPAVLYTHLLVAEAREFLDDEARGVAFLRAARRRIGLELQKIKPPDPTSVTLTSRGGVIPLTIRNLAGYPLRVRVRLLSPRLDFLEGAARVVVLSRETQSFTFPVRAQTTGRFPVRVLIETPDGSRLVAESQIVVRSTAFNRAALALTIGAAAFLALWWGRRLLRRQRS
ncbi:MAG: DUF6049 family protein [Actinomycetota bacterium]